MRIPGILLILFLILLRGGLFSGLFVLLRRLGGNLGLTFGREPEQNLVVRRMSRPISESFIPKLNHPKTVFFYK